MICIRSSRKFEHRRASEPDGDSGVGDRVQAIRADTDMPMRLGQNTMATSRSGNEIGLPLSGAVS